MDATVYNDLLIYLTVRCEGSYFVYNNEIIPGLHVKKKKGLHDRPCITIHVYRMILIEITYGISSRTSTKTHILI